MQTPELRRSQPPSIALDGLLLALLFFEPIGELELVEVDQATSLDGLVAAVLVEREPVHLALCRSWVCPLRHCATTWTA